MLAERGLTDAAQIDPRVRWGRAIRRRRRFLELTQRELADLVGVTGAAISQWERGTTAPRPELQLAIARALDVEWAELFDLEGAA